MEAVIGLLFVLLLLLILMLPVIILFGLFGLAFKSVGAAGIFALKYLFPFGIAGIIIAKIVDKKGYFEGRDYLAFFGGGILAGLVAVLIFLNITVGIKIPESEDVTEITVSFEDMNGVHTAKTDTDWRIDNLVGLLSGAEYKRTLKEFTEDMGNGYVYTLTLTDSKGKEHTVILYNYHVIGIKKGSSVKYYRMTEETVPLDWAKNIFDLKEEAEYRLIWEPFVEELFGSIKYNEEYQEITFVVPNEIPTEGKYYIDIYVEGLRGYTKGEFEPTQFLIYEDEQANNTWIKGYEYYIPFEDITFSRLTISVNAPYINDDYVYDVMPLIPKDRVYKK